MAKNSDHWCVPIGQYLEGSALIAESFDLVLCFHWLKAAARCVPIGQYLKASALIAESFDLVHEAVLFYFYWLRAVATGAFLLVNT